MINQQAVHTAEHAHVRDVLAPREGQAVAHCAEQCQVFPGEARATLDTQMQPQELAGPAPALSAQHGPEVEKWLVTDKDYPDPARGRPGQRAARAGAHRYPVRAVDIDGVISAPARPRILHDPSERAAAARERRRCLRRKVPTDVRKQLQW